MRSAKPSIIAFVITLLVCAALPASGATVVQARRQVIASWNGAGRDTTEISTQPGYWLGIVLSSVSPSTQTNQESEITESGVSYNGRIYCGLLCEAESSLTLDFRVDDQPQDWSLFYKFEASSAGVTNGYIQLTEVDSGQVFFHLSPVDGLGSGLLQSSVSLLPGNLYRLEIRQLEPLDFDEWGEWRFAFVVPEPSTSLLLGGLWLLGLAANRRRCRVS